MNMLPTIIRSYWLALVILLAPFAARAALASNFAADTNGTWSNAAIWMPSGGPPGVNDYAYIGSINSEMSRRRLCERRLEQISQEVGNLVLGFGTATGGTLNLAGYPFHGRTRRSIWDSKASESASLNITADTSTRNTCKSSMATRS